ncbi:hypothetical protein [Paracoccus liaowanqingii]|uniref:hypothetical protein n=1 Tax=Paracoccus liaowanqingii TaxID=2560053 RepID=UPI00159BBFD6|nr:hypothetical protein [Paracoccus liaowanqingii]
MFPRLASLALLILPLAACDTQALSDLRRGIGLDQAAAEPEVPAGPRPPAVSPLEQPIETAEAPPRPVSMAEPLTYRNTAFLAGGNEPAWTVEIAGNTATYRTPDSPSGRQIPVNRLVFNQGVEYIGVLNGRPFVVNLRAERCRDSMSGARLPLTARLTVAGEAQPGCGTPGAAPAPVEAAPVATAPVAPAAQAAPPAEVLAAPAAG